MDFDHFYFETTISAADFVCPPLKAETLSRRLQMSTTRYLPFAGRLMIGLPFAMGGFGKLAAYGATVGMITAVGLPVPPLAFAVAVAVEFGGGLLLIAGYQTRFVAAALAIFSLVTAFSFHNNFADQNQMIHFLKNVMMAGGLLQIVAFGAGALSLDNRLGKNPSPAHTAVAA
jgi:putative oxidoreductase